MSRVFLILCALLFLLVTAKGAFAQSFEITWTGGYGPGTAYFNGTPNAGPSGGFLLTSLITGTQNSVSLTGLDTVGSYGGNDNLVLLTTPPGLVDLAGIAFSDGTYSYNIYDYSGTLLECSSEFTICHANGSGVDLTGLSVTETPEPSTNLLFLSGIGILLIAVARKASAAKHSVRPSAD
jgi:hypothetical protein